jgi:hypothetical protein
MFSNRSATISEKFIIKDLKPLVETIKKKVEFIPNLIFTLIVGSVLNAFVNIKLLFFK